LVKVGIVGFGNLGKGVLSALETAIDMECSVIFSRRVEDIAKQVSNEILVLNPENWKFSDLNKDNMPDIVILCGGSKDDVPIQGPMFAKWFSTVDSYDTHAKIPEYMQEMEKAARNNDNVAIISTGWDPGLFSLMRVLFKSILPCSEDYTFWGTGVSQGHSDAIRTIDGVLDARQYTIPIDEAINSVRSGANPVLSIREKHKRVCYVVAKEKANLDEIEKSIKKMPNYFSDYDTEVNFVSLEELKKNHSELPHGGFVLSSGTTDRYQQSIEFGLKLESNPYFTGSVLVAYARAAYRFKQQEIFGAFTVLDIPPKLLSPLSAEDLIKMI